MYEQALASAKELGLDWKVFEQEEKALTPPDQPPELGYLWEIFVGLCTGRTFGFGPNPLTWGDIWAYARLHGFRFEYWELQALKMLDALWMKILGQQKDKQDG